MLTRRECVDVISFVDINLRDRLWRFTHRNAKDSTVLQYRPWSVMPDARSLSQAETTIQFQPEVIIITWFVEVNNDLQSLSMKLETCHTMPTLLSLAAPEFVITTTYSAVSDGKVDSMMILRFSDGFFFANFKHRPNQKNTIVCTSPMFAHCHADIAYIWRYNISIWFFLLLWLWSR